MSQLLEALASKEGFDKSLLFQNYLRKKAFDNGIPLIGTFELTPQCTLDCAMCYVHLNKSQMHREELKTEEWITLIDQACDAGMIYAVLTGGECLMYPGFKDIYQHLQARGVLITILTNGTLLDAEMVNWLSERTPQRIQISVYGSTPEGYERVTGNANAFYKVDKAINLIKNAAIPFNLAITLSKQLLIDFENTLIYCRKKEPHSCNVTVFSFITREETGRIYNNFALSIDEQVEINKIRFKLDGKVPIPYSCENDLFESIKLNSIENDYNITNGIQCTAGRIKFSIDWDGKMSACNTFRFVETYPLKDDFISSWKNINKKSCEYIHPLECKTCNYKKACIPCPATHWMTYGEGKINPMICEEAKRMAIEGLRSI